MEVNWNAQVDGYCERTGPEFWSEPVNAVTNAAFLVAALIMWARGGGTPFARPLAVILFAIGIGSGLFHTLATRWAGMADTLPILLFILTYIFAVNRSVLGLSRVWAAVGTAAFIPWTAALTPAFASLPFFDVSSFYWPVPALILLYAAALWRGRPAVARGLLIGAAILVASLTFRSLDERLCDGWPIGTHFLWHILNATMLAWMIEVLVRHRLAGPVAGRGPQR